MKAVFFDLDGTLLDTVEDIRAAINYALRAYDGEEASRDEVFRYVGRGLRRAFQSAVDEKHPRGIVDDNEFSLAYSLMMEHYRRHPADHTVPYPGIPSLLERLADEGCRLGVVSNKDDGIVQAIISRFFPNAFGFVSGQRPDFPLKPDPSLLLHGLRCVGAVPEESVYIGDSEVDWETGKRAGVRTAVVSYGFRSAEELASCGIKADACSVGELSLLL